MSLRVRAYRRDDEHSIMAGFNTSFGLTRDDAYWRWKFLRTAKAIAWLAVDEQERVLAHLAAHPVTWCSEYGDWQVAHAGDAFALRLPEVVHGRAMLKTFAAFHREQRERGELKLLFGFPSTTLSGLHEKQSPLVGEQRPIRIWQHLPQGDYPNPLVRIGLPKPSTLDNLWRRCAQRFALSCPRNSEWVSWRFLKRPDVQDYVYMHAVDYAGSLACWVVLRELEGVLWVCDVLWDGCCVESIESLLRQTLLLALVRQCSRVSMWMEGDAALTEVLANHGWRDASQEHCVKLLMHSYDSTLDYQWIRDSLYITKADSDLI